MAGRDVRQRLAAILAADVAGYSRLMGQDERATIDSLNTCRDIFGSAIEDNGGRVVDMAGDSVLAVFDTATGAGSAAIEAQARLSDFNAKLPEERRMLYRIGLNIGDIHEQDDGSIYGDGVNVAARLEALAEPGGICVSGKVRDELRGKIDRSFADLGEHKVKNIADPIRAYRVIADGDTTTPEGFRRAILAGVAVVAVILVATVGYWWFVGRDTAPDLVTADGTPTDDPLLAMPTGPAIAVLPFANLSGDPAQEYFSDGIAEGIITELTRFSDLFVISRTSTIQYKEEPKDVREIGRELGADYVLEGSVRRNEGTVRVTAQLLDASNGGHLWGDTFDRDLTATDIFAVQDEITQKVASTIAAGYGAIFRHSERAAASKSPSQN